MTGGRGEVAREEAEVDIPALASRLFQQADRNGDGTLSHTEVKRLLKAQGVRDKMGISSGERVSPNVHNSQCFSHSTSTVNPPLP